MKNIKKICFFLIACLAFSCQENTDDGSYEPPKPDIKKRSQASYREKAMQTFELIQQNYKLSASGLYLENYPKQSGDRECSYLWSLDGLISGANQLKALGYKNGALNDPFIALEKYYDTQRVPNAYPAYPVQYGQNDRYYDDNAIVALDLIENYEITGNVDYLNRAEQQVEFSKTGENNLCGGGLYWVEQHRNDVNDELCIKAVCSSAFTTTYLLKLYQITKKQEYLTLATRIYTWLNTYMQDPVDKLFWNDMAVKDQTINKTKWTYNSGAMITNNILLYEINREQVYLDRAKEIASSTFKNFIRTVNGKPFFPAHDSWFNVCLFRGYLKLYEHDPSAQIYVNTFIANADYAWDYVKNSYDMFYEDWAGEIPGRDYWLLQQAALVETYGRIALLKGEKAE